MLIQFNFKGADHRAHVLKNTDNDLEVVVDDIQIEQQYGASFHYSVKGDEIEFTPLNPSHSELYALQSQIKNAMVKQNLFQ